MHRSRASGNVHEAIHFQRQYSLSEGKNITPQYTNPGQTSATCRSGGASISKELSGSTTEYDIDACENNLLEIGSNREPEKHVPANALHTGYGTEMWAN